MLSTQGYSNSIPQLARANAGGQMVYVLQLAKVLSEQVVIILATQGPVRSTGSLDYSPAESYCERVALQ